MKKYRVILTALIMLFGCSYQNDSNTEILSSINTTAPIVTTTNANTTTTSPKITTSITTVSYNTPEYHEQLMNGDFTVIAGEYVAQNGEVVILNEKGLKNHNEEAVSEVYFIESFNIYQMSLFKKNEIEGGYMLTIYPVGIEVYGGLGDSYGILNTDTSKIRIYYGQSSPKSEDEIYTKK